MKCKKCGAKASVNMRQHKLALCKEHYLDWVPEQTERFIKKYEMFTQHERILVAVSGGKDSLGLWDILVRLGYQADGLYLGLGIDGGIEYSHESQRLTQEFADARGLKLHIVDIEKE
jgi:tRNA(Ile)-lysidine synthase TilS/MesJ